MSLARGLAAQKRAFEVHVDDAVEVFLLHAHHQPVVGDAGVVHQHIKAAKRLMSRGNKRAGLIGIAHAGRYGKRLHAVLRRKLIGVFLQRGEAAFARAVQAHVVAGLRKLAGNGQPDASRRAGDQRTFALGIVRFAHGLLLIGCAARNERLE